MEKEKLMNFVERRKCEPEPVNTFQQQKMEDYRYFYLLSVSPQEMGSHQSPTHYQIM
jgi:hypothetical protein